MKEIPDKIEWTISVSIFSNSIILKQLGIAIGIPFGLLILWLLYVKAYYALGLIAVLFFLTFLFIMIVWGGKHNVGFKIDRTGIRSYTLKRQAKKNRIINSLTFVLGLLSGKPAVAGAAMLAQSRQEVLLNWRSIKKAKYIPCKNIVIIKGGIAENIAVFCTKDNYKDVEAFIRLHLQTKNNAEL